MRIIKQVYSKIRFNREMIMTLQYIRDLVNKLNKAIDFYESKNLLFGLYDHYIIVCGRIYNIDNTPFMPVNTLDFTALDLHERFFKELEKIRYSGYFAIKTGTNMFVNVNEIDLKFLDFVCKCSTFDELEIQLDLLGV